MASEKLLAIYLNDHLAAATAAVELVRRSRKSNAGTPLGEYLERLAGEIEDDRAMLVRLMEELGIGRDRVKVTGGWLAEKAGRLKLNGQIRGYSPLSRVVELETLQLSVSGSGRMWLALGRALGSEVAGFDFDALAVRAQAQAEQLEGHRLAAAAAALAAPVPKT